MHTCEDRPVQVGDKWTGHVLRQLENGPRRFTEMRRNIDTVTPKVLTETLRAMQREGMLERTEFDEVPPRVEYALTDRSMLELLDHTCEWTRRNLPRIREARHAGAR